MPTAAYTVFRAIETPPHDTEGPPVSNIIGWESSGAPVAVS